MVTCLVPKGEISREVFQVRPQPSRAQPWLGEDFGAARRAGLRAGRCRGRKADTLREPIGGSEGGPTGVHRPGVGLGEGIDDLVEFDAHEFVDALFA